MKERARAQSRGSALRADGGGVPLSPAQRRLWFLDQFEEGEGTYNIAHATRLRGDLDVTALRRAHEFVAERHEILRTRYPDTGGIPRQVVDPTPFLDFQIVTDITDGIDAYLASEAVQGFDLANGPIWRLRLIRLADDDHVLLTVVHHIAADGWSFPVLRSEVREAYVMIRAARDPELPPLPLQYADFTLRQLDHPPSPEDLEFWRRRFRDDPDPLPLVADRPRLARRSAAGFWISAPVPIPIDRFEGIARSLQATPFVLGLTLWVAYLSRICRVDDVVVGIPEAQRSWGAAEQLIGPFVNTLPIRVNVDSGRSLRETAGSVRHQVLEALDHSIPFDDIVRQVDPRRDPSHSPLFQVMYQYHDGMFRSDYELPGLTEEMVRVAGSMSKFDLTLELRGAGEALTATMSVNADMYEQATAESVLEGFVTFCQSALDDLDRPLRGTRTTRAATRRWLVEDLNDTARDLPAGQTLAEIYRSSTAGRSGETAIRHGALRISHAQLQRAADRIGDQLSGVGVSPGDTVGLEMGRSPAGIAAMLAVTSIGAVYVPLDPSHPQHRREQMIRTAGVRVIVRPGSGDDWHDVSLSTSAAEAVPLDSADQPVYIMFTSGSTGTPKGVVVGQRAVLRLVCNTDYVTLQPGDVVAHLSNSAFDASTFEVWGPLVNGASLAIIDQDTLLSPDAFADELSRSSVTTAFVTTAWFNEMARRRPDAFAPLRELLFGGERCDPNAVRAVLEAGPPQRLLHVYGPTETTTFATWYEVEEVEPGASTVSIGKPIANTKVYVLDGWGEPVPPLVAGELHIGGPGVALGYVNDESTTRSRFLTDPFGDDPWGRLYRTGDLVRMQPDGRLEFLGRDDRQIKLRGFRIEPHEIEQALRGHGGVTDAYVRLDESGADRRLIAWAAVGDEEVSDAELKNHLAGLVPGYMVPATVIPVPSFPLSPNGKLDLSQLPAPIHDRPSSALLSATEARLAGLFGRTLEIDSVGPFDDFFDLGGHSIRAVELISRIEGEFGVRVPVSSLFDAPTPAALAALLDGDSVPDAESPIILMRASDGPPIFIFHHPSGTVLAYQNLVRHLDAPGPVYGVQARGVDGSHSPASTIEEMASEYLDHIARIAGSRPVALIGHSLGGLLAWETALRLVDRGHEISMVALLDTKFPQRSHVRTLRAMGHSHLRARGLSAYRSVRRVAGSARWGLATAWYTSRNERLPAELARVRLVRASSRAFGQYRPRRYEGDVDYFLAAEQGPKGMSDLTLWTALCGRLRVEHVPGTHTGPDSLLDEPNVITLAHALGRRLTVVGSSEGIST